MSYVIGVDSGGTFTDAVIVDGEGRIYFDKAMSTPRDPEQGVIAGVENCVGLIQPQAETQHVLSQTDRFCHGTTVATNALIQRKGANVGLLMTKGFEDTIIITRGPIARVMGISPAEAMDFIHTERANPLVPKRMIRGVTERVGVDGEVIVPLDEEEVIEATQDLIQAGAEIISVCLLWSFRNGSHERRIKELISSVDSNLQVNLSSEISPIIGEFERASTAVVNAYVAPVVVQYINNLQAELAKRGLNRPVQIMKSSGGLIPSEYIDREAVSTFNSGPVGGVMASKYLGEAMGYRNIITTDMGGTSFDVGVIHREELEEERTPFVSQGIPVQVPTVKVVSVGAGGGSIAWTDGRRLMVGPQSAGAEPGPACYDQGGTEPTVTDALVVLGFLDPENFFGGRKKLNRARAETAIRDKVAEPLGLDIMEAADGIYEIVTAKMADLIRKVTVESGYDPREFALFAFGGAGPSHCALYGKALGVREIIIPRTAAVFSALGIAFCDIKYTYTRSELVTLEADTRTADRINHMFDEMDERAMADMDTSGFSAETITLRHRLDVRYVGQMNELTIPWEREDLIPERIPDIRRLFEQTYEMKFGQGTTRPESALEIINLRVEAVKLVDKPELRAEADGPADPSTARTGTREVYRKGGEPLPATVYDYNRLAPGSIIEGPSVIERRDTTIFVPPGHDAKMDGFRNIKIQIRRDE